MHATMKRYLLRAAVGASLVVTSCQTVQTTHGGVVGVDRPQQMSVFTPSAAEVAATAQQQYLQVMQGRSPGCVQSRSDADCTRAAYCSAADPHTAVFRDDAVRWQWQVNVLTSPEVNAWCMPGGKMAVYTGLIQQLEPTDDELAAVMGHELRMRYANTCVRGWDGAGDGRRDGRRRGGAEVLHGSTPWRGGEHLHAGDVRAAPQSGK
jgi:Zn-dependent protease with chaperone function